MNLDDVQRLVLTQLLKTSSLDDVLHAVSEDIRLVVWDLDETFWSGTLTEGGFSYVESHHNLVIELAKRGIMSTISSKNDHATVRAILEEKGLWDYFIYPSIDWMPKAHRIKAQIEAIGLRAPSVLFIDDNWQNLQQAAALIMGLNVAEPRVIPEIASHRRFRGKSDPALSRLSQYKNNERKHIECERAGGDNIAFLRESDVRVYLEYDVEKHIERTIELINRTSQLNFTKERVSEDVEEAKLELLPLIRHAGTKAGLIRVVDKYGDYGFVGLFVMTSLNHVYTLKQFCFSCRTINMYIEHFVYNYLGRPGLTVVGDVLSDLFSTETTYDWIRALPIAQMETGERSDVLRIDSIYARGGCDLSELMHYFTLNCSEVTQEFNCIKDWQPLRADHSAFLLNSLNGLTDDQLAAAAKLAYRPEDFTTQFPTEEGSASLCLLSFWADVDIPFYRHRATGLELPYFVVGAAKEDLRTDRATVARLGTNEFQLRRIEVLMAEWDYHYGLSHSELVERYRGIIVRIPQTTRVFMTLANERHPQHFANPVEFPRDANHVAYNEALREAVYGFDNVDLIDLNSYVTSADDILDLNHLRRYLYFKIYEEIVARL